MENQSDVVTRALMYSRSVVEPRIGSSGRSEVLSTLALVIRMSETAAFLEKPIDV